MANNIVTLTVTQQVAASPSTLQRTGAIISQGGTNTAANTLSLLTQPADLTPLLATAKAITSITWSGSVATITTSAPHGWTTSETVGIIVAGAVPAGYNGSFQGTVSGASTITYPLVANPGSETTPGTVQLADEAELLTQATTFFAQGSGVSVYVLELGEGTPADGVTALTTFITANPGLIYSYLVPREWDAVASFLTFLAGFEANTSKTYFFVTTTTANYTSYTALMKCVFALIEAPTKPATEFTCAAPFRVTLNYNPGSSSKVTPLAFSYLFGVTAYALTGNAALFATLKAANINIVGTGAEGGISNTILFWGHLKDGNPFNYWYSIDWAQINIAQALANAVINGSNNTTAPLPFSQQGINILQDVATRVFNSAVTNGLAIGAVKQTSLPVAEFVQNFEANAYQDQLVVNAEPFLIYTTENPNDYAIGKYAGLTGTYLPARGFEQIIFALDVANFV